MKENLTKQILKVAGRKLDSKQPLSVEQSHRLFVHLQTMRYLLAMYGEEKLWLSEITCPKSFTRYLRAVVKTSNNVYAWPNEDIVFMKDVTYNPLPLEDLFSTLNQLKEVMKNEPYFVLC
jgi:hypothetical protein